MLRFRYFNLLLALALAASLQAEELPTLEELRAQYEEEKREAVAPVNKAFVAALDRLQQQLSRDGKMDDALVVLQRKQEITEAAKEGKTIEMAEPPAASPTPEDLSPQQLAEIQKSAESGELYDPVGTTWIWSAPTSQFVFSEAGKGRSTSTLPTVDPAEHTWERKGPRSFLIRRPEIDGFLVLFEVLADGDTAVYSNLGGSIFKRMVSRVP